MKYEVGDGVKVNATGRVGMVIDTTRSEVIVSFYDKDYNKPEIQDFLKKDVSPFDLPRIRVSEVRPYVRGELSLSKITDGVNIISDEIIDDTDSDHVASAGKTASGARSASGSATTDSAGADHHVVLSAEDLLCGLRFYKDKAPVEILMWFDTIKQINNFLDLFDVFPQIRDAVTERDIVSYVCDELESMEWVLLDSDDDDTYLKKSLSELEDVLNVWVVSGGTEFHDYIAAVVTDNFDEDSIDHEPEETQQFFKTCLDRLCEKKNPRAIQKRGYCYYVGTKVYPNDWVKARDAFIEYYEMTGDASAANTLGYIYYYGRCNGGEPEYDKAFKYFSIGHAYTYFESTYKLADMFANGYGVVKSGETAHQLYWSVYTETIEKFIRGEFECKFADAALRMGNCFRDGIGVDKEPDLAYYYYLQADLAIRKRMEVSDQYGDKTVFNRIQTALEESRKEYTEKGKTIRFYHPNWVVWVLTDYRLGRLKLSELSNGVISIEATTIPRSDEDEAPMKLISIPKADYCELKKKIRIKTSKGAMCNFPGNPEEIVFDHVEFEHHAEDDNVTIFYLWGKYVGEIHTEYYTFTATTTAK
ncbi:MAG: sel1 repeat family protein [Lachnospiraceae bacterium]|nr:sel1 repeat family protein [Lachnospiraceae bacterium]